MFFPQPYVSPVLAATGGNPLLDLLPFILIFLVMYFLIIRPQQKRLQEHKDMVAALRKGDTVVTGGGIIGKVTKVVEGEIEVEIAKDVRVTVLRSTISDVRTKGKPV